MPDATTIRQIELQLYKAERGMGMPYDTERVAALRRMLREARKQKLSQALAAKRGQPPRYEPPKDLFRQLAVNYRQLAKIAGDPEIKQRMFDMADDYQAKADARRSACDTRQARMKREQGLKCRGPAA